jgi:hypothetical protein
MPQRRQPLTITPSVGRVVGSLMGRVVGSPVGGYIGGLLVVPLGWCPSCCLGVADSATDPLQAAPVLGVCASEVVLCPILYCIDVFSTYLGEILDFVVVHWSFIFVSQVSRLIVEFI